MFQRSTLVKGLVVVPALVGTLLANPTSAGASPTSTAVKPGKIIEASNHSFYDGSATGGGYIYLQGVALKTTYGKAKIQIAVEAIRVTGGPKGPVAENWDICRGATHCQVTRFEGHGQHAAKIGKNFCGQFDTVAKATLWIGHKQITDVHSQTYNFKNGEEETSPPDCVVEN